jgi:hypothetical protein
MVTKMVDVILGDELLQTYQVNDRGYEGPRGNTPPTDRDFEKQARRCALEDKLLTEEAAEKVRFVVRD